MTTTMKAPKLLLALLIAVAVLELPTIAHAGCAPPSRVYNGVCTTPSPAAFTITYVPGMKPGQSYTGSREEREGPDWQTGKSRQIWFGGYDEIKNVAPGQYAWYQFLNYNAQKIVVTCKITSATQWLLVYEDDRFVGEYQAPVDKLEILAKGRGIWTFKVVNWGTAAANIDMTKVEGDGFCLNAYYGRPPPAPLDIAFCPYICEKAGEWMHADGVCKGDTNPNPDPVVPTAGQCAYKAAAGFNPWERWNVFSLGDATFDGSSVDGRVAANGAIEVKNGAQMHLLLEPFIPKRVASWSISAGKTIGSSGGSAILNGGVEAAGSAPTLTGTSIGDFPVVGPVALSAPLAAIGAYFSERSQAFEGMAESPFKAVKVSATEIRIRVHAKVNVVNGITAEDLAAARTIVLEGHPLGVAVLNVGGAAVAISELQVVYADGKGGAPATPTFGRVLLNLFAATTLSINKDSTQDGAPMHFSVLAPNAMTTFARAGSQIAGTVVVGGLNAKGSFALQPFGTPAKRLSPPQAPTPATKPWTAAGKRAVSCLWQVL